MATSLKNIADGASLSCSSNFNDAMACPKLADGDLTTQWHSQDDSVNAWVNMVFDRQYALVGLAVHTTSLSNYVPSELSALFDDGQSILVSILLSIK